MLDAVISYAINSTYIDFAFVALTQFILVGVETWRP